MRVLVACEFSGVVREAFHRRGHAATSCDLLPTEIPGDHYQGDVRDLLTEPERWDLLIAHPPCTFLTVSGNRWMKPEEAGRFPGRSKQRQEAIDFFMLFTRSGIRRWAIENPTGVMSSHYRPPDQRVQPWHFGDSFSKGICLWLHNLPLLQATVDIFKPYEKGEFIRLPSGKRMPKWYAKLGPGPNS